MKIFKIVITFSFLGWFLFLNYYQSHAQQGGIYPKKDNFHPVVAKNGMVATQKARATQIAVDVLKKGGNAIDALVADVMALRTEDDYGLFMDRYGIRRTDTRFWRYSDKLHQRYRERQPIRYGLLDYNRLENR